MRLLPPLIAAALCLFASGAARAVVVEKVDILGLDEEMTTNVRVSLSLVDAIGKELSGRRLGFLLREADDEALQRAHVFVDTEAALHEGGDVAVAIKAGAYEASKVAGTLAGLCRGEYNTAAERDDVTLFKSVGTALEDLAAAILVWQLAN